MKKTNNSYITIVSGLPRSGTSMMMRMLDKGGMDVVIDNIRKADDDNPKGYYEFEQVKKIKEDKSWLDDTVGKVFKMVSMLLFELPSDKKYKIIFMRRNMEEILQSQKVMLERGNKVVDDNEKMGEIFEKHLKNIFSWLQKQSHIDVCYVNYNEMLKNPEENAKKVYEFLDKQLDYEKMINVVDPSLYRNRKN